MHSFLISPFTEFCGTLSQGGSLHLSQHRKILGQVSRDQKGTPWGETTLVFKQGGCATTSVGEKSVNNTLKPIEAQKTA